MVGGTLSPPYVTHSSTVPTSSSTVIPVRRSSKRRPNNTRHKRLQSNLVISFTIIVFNVNVVSITVICSTTRFVHLKGNVDVVIIMILFCNVVIDDGQIKGPCSSSRYIEIKDMQRCSNVDVLKHKIFFGKSSVVVYIQEQSTSETVVSYLLTIIVKIKECLSVNASSGSNADGNGSNVLRHVSVPSITVREIQICTRESLHHEKTGQTLTISTTN